MIGEVIKQAINGRRQVVAYRDGHLREFCPHIIGWKQGVYHVLTWQFGGYSSQTLPEGGAWRCFDVNELEGVTLRDGPWHRGWTTGRGVQHCVDVVELAVAEAFAAEVRQTSQPRTLTRAPRPPGPKTRR